MNLSPFNIGAVFMAGCAWVLMCLYWIDLNVHVFYLVHGLLNGR